MNAYLLLHYLNAARAVLIDVHIIIQFTDIILYNNNKIMRFLFLQIFSRYGKVLKIVTFTKNSEYMYTYNCVIHLNILIYINNENVVYRTNTSVRIICIHIIIMKIYCHIGKTRQLYFCKNFNSFISYKYISYVLLLFLSDIFFHPVPGNVFTRTLATRS